MACMQVTSSLYRFGNEVSTQF